MKYFLIILFFFAACKKNNDPTSTTQVSYDSVVSNFLREYRIDLNKDQQFDFKIVWRSIPFQISITTYHIIPLHNMARVHVIKQSEDICFDTIPFGTSYFTNTHNCSQGSVGDSIITFFATPNLDLNQLSQTVFSTQAIDSFLIFETYQKHNMPGPGSTMILIESGFFVNKQSGYLLLETNSKKYGLLIHNKYGWWIEKQVAIP
jgi:hypothetical protein